MAVYEVFTLTGKGVHIVNCLISTDTVKEICFSYNFISILFAELTVHAHRKRRIKNRNKNKRRERERERERDREG